MAYRDSGVGTLVIDRRLGKVGRVKRASGTNDPVVFDRINTLLTSLVRQRRWGDLATVANGDLRPVDLLVKHECGDAAIPWAVPKTKRLYIIRAKVTGRLKIGVSVAPHARLKTLSIGSEPCELVLVVRAGGGALERELQQRFRHLRVHREWFEPGPDLLAWIAERKSQKRCSYATAHQTLPHPGRVSRGTIPHSHSKSI